MKGEDSDSPTTPKTRNENLQVKSHPADAPLTQIVRGVDEVMKLGAQITSSVKEKLCVYADRNAPALNLEITEYDKAYRSMKSRGVKIQFITEITKENLAACKRIIKEHGVELRHANETILGYFSIADEKEFMASSSVRRSEPIAQALYSNSSDLVEQYEHLFASLWKSAIPAESKIREIEDGVVPLQTRVIVGYEQGHEAVLAFIEKAASASALSSTQSDPSGGGESLSSAFVYTIAGRENPSRAISFLEFVGNLSKSNPDFDARYITDIQEDNIEYVRQIVQAGVKVRHLEGNRVGFSVSQFEYLNHYAPAIDPKIGKNAQPDSEVNELLWSNNLDLVTQARDVYRVLWESAVPAATRLKQLETGTAPAETRVLRDVDEAAKLARGIISETKNEVLIILGSEKTIIRNEAMYSALVRESKERNFTIKILAPITNEELANTIFQGAPWRRISGINTGIAIYDRSKMLITQYSDANSESSEGVSNIYTTNRSTIEGIVSVFDALWRESELREREERSRKQSQLLQDIMAHDIRNFNQVAQLGAEMLASQFKENPDVVSITGSIMSAIEGSTQLVDKARKFGRIISEEHPKLIATDLAKSIETSVRLVRNAFPGKQISLSFANESRGTQVLADALLDEVFVNLFMNSTKYTDSDEVVIELAVSESKDKPPTRAREGKDPTSSSSSSYWEISIADHGKGIPDEAKKTIFDRYLKTAKGSGLGLSIVYALVVDRYKGMIEVTNRVTNTPSSGTVVTLWLPKS